MNELILIGQVFLLCFTAGFIGPLLIGTVVLGYIALNKIIAGLLWVVRKLKGGTADA